ncbi:hypothetical protein APHWI1_0347 [Anaplasma phagocytophilum str. ApWI1]|uniref:Uncharacterized protein n=2 Tax=Anaplasma phagocytophilum TaxID=948 RepID=Q2GJN3_ANAPZ|nr:hypothetical protein APH_0841 [Anaplasma phagocytophilum str. HZ]KJV59967.1 hypothetical protein APHWEB_1170 [Anaplasma phagocytophilum str. Webster]KJV83184.1 hypothetical protein APHHGE2_1143 [Anaplasma phagocytophilum str. HGE2]KJV85183.1 hypothetical protein APHWI1_0347 [Anaplasma phagocytophilum str. ApWI1]KJV87240.1 hypothetical protein APHNYW_0857 [Anaplasma phagocytophilum str. ApNYW]
MPVSQNLHCAHARKNMGNSFNMTVINAYIWNEEPGMIEKLCAALCYREVS